MQLGTPRNVAADRQGLRSKTGAGFTVAFDDRPDTSIITAGLMSGCMQVTFVFC